MFGPACSVFPLNHLISNPQWELPVITSPSPPNRFHRKCVIPFLADSKAPVAKTAHFWVSFPICQILTFGTQIWLDRDFIDSRQWSRVGFNAWLPCDCHASIMVCPQVVYQIQSGYPPSSSLSFKYGHKCLRKTKMATAVTQNLRLQSPPQKKQWLRKTQQVTSYFAAAMDYNSIP